MRLGNELRSRKSQRLQMAYFKKETMNGPFLCALRKLFLFYLRSFFTNLFRISSFHLKLWWNFIFHGFICTYCKSYVCLHVSMLMVRRVLYNENMDYILEFKLKLFTSRAIGHLLSNSKFGQVQPAFMTSNVDFKVAKGLEIGSTIQG